MAENRSSFQNLGGGVYRVGGAHRSAVTGRYVNSSAAASNPRTTSTEHNNSHGSKPSQG
ncbi:hypothetical protein SAMN06309945_2750 [Okibacterium fritillariae]|uniref:Uncharacterized protein n=1 Tax=Okibacterium fritillariae TaxID=123320 RepID=A0A1T5L084_9MICO|nr:hypothetical protein SAMN06309945_2750 [Okibacterium fritillariae]